MTNAFSLFRSLVIYSICLPLAILVGYLLATPTDFTSYVPIAVVLVLLTIPIFLRWHYQILVLSLNMIAGLFFLPGKPSVAFVMIFLSFGFSFLAFVMNRNLRFISVPSITRPLIFMTVVVLATGKLTGGIGLNVMGSESIGGKRYLFLLSGVIVYFALAARRIPAEKANLYIKMFFLSTLTSLIGLTFAFITPSLDFIFLMFPADNSLAMSDGPGGGGMIVRLGGVALASIAIIWAMLARYSLKGVLDTRSIWRLLLVSFLAASTLFGGYRSKFIEVLLIFMVLFYLEGLVRSRLLPVLILCGLLVGTVIFPFADKLPLSVQRSMAVLPLVKIDDDVVRNTRDTTEWRLEMWRNVIPTIPQYLILGKGLSMDAHDLEMLQGGLTAGTGSAYGSQIAGDYHNGPLSVIIPFGIPGVIAFIWFLVAAIRALHRNCQFGDPALLQINRVLFAYFIVKCIMFFVVVGSFYADMIYFAAPLGLSIAINGGVCRRTIEPALSVPILNRFKLANATR